MPTETAKEMVLDMGREPDIHHKHCVCVIQVDLHEVFMAAIIFCSMRMRDKTDFVFRMFAEKNSGTMTMEQMGRLIVVSIRSMCKMIGITIDDLTTSSLYAIDKLLHELCEDMKLDLDGNIRADEFWKWVICLPDLLGYVHQHTDGVDVRVGIKNVEAQVKDCVQQFEDVCDHENTVKINTAMSLLKQCISSMDAPSRDFIAKGISEIDGRVTKTAFTNVCRALTAFSVVDKKGRFILMDFQFRVSEGHLTHIVSGSQLFSSFLLMDDWADAESLVDLARV